MLISLFKISNYFDKGCIHVPKGKSNSCCRVRASQSLYKFKFKDYDKETLHNKRTRIAKNNQLNTLTKLPIVEQRIYLSERELKQNSILFY